MKAVQGVEAYHLGNSAELLTVIDIGLNNEIKQRGSQYEASENKISTELQTLTEGVSRLEKVRDKKTLEQFPEYQQIKTAIEMKQEELAKLHQDKVNYNDYIKKLKQAEAKFAAFVYPGSVVIIDGVSLHVKEKLTGVTFRKINDRIAVFSNVVKNQ